MAITYSTREVHPRDRVSYWLEVATKEFYGHDFRSGVGPSFLAELFPAMVGELWAGRCKCEPCDIHRGPSHIARDDVDDILLSVRLFGTTLIAQGGHEAVHGAGTMALLDTRRPSDIHFQSPTDSIVIRFPREPLAARLGELAGLTARPVSTDGPVAGLATGFLSMLAERAGSLDDATGLKLCEQALDLVALAFSSEVGLNGVTLSSPRAAALMRVKSAIEARLCDADLKPATVAAAAGISVRYANALLAEEGTSVERYVLSRRLERCRQALEDPGQARRMIGEIAFAWGFSDLSHFGRRFRAAYGMTPGEYRRRAQETGKRERQEQISEEETTVRTGGQRQRIRA
jgi:AraC-like DNA-binding protein